MIAHDHNLFHHFAEALVLSDLPDAHLVAGAGFASPELRTPELTGVLDDARAHASSAVHALEAHYRDCRAAQSSPRRFADGCSGALTTAGQQVVQFTVECLAKAPAVYRVQFSRVGAGRATTRDAGPAQPTQTA